MLGGGAGWDGLRRLLGRDVVFVYMQCGGGEGYGFCIHALWGQGGTWLLYTCTAGAGVYIWALFGVGLEQHLVGAWFDAGALALVFVH